MRLDNHDNYDRSTYLTKVRKVPIREFEGYPEKETGKSLIQGGNFDDRDCWVPGTRPDQYYDPTQKEKNLMERLNKKILPFENYESRLSGKSIYRIDNSCPVDPLNDSFSFVELKK